MNLKDFFAAMSVQDLLDFDPAEVSKRFALLENLDAEAALGLTALLVDLKTQAL